MTSKEVQEMINDIEEQIERFGIMNSMKVQLNVLKSYKQDLDRLEKVEKALEDIKKLPNCDICDANWHKGCMCLKKKIDEVLRNE